MSLSDRDYMWDETRRWRWSASIVLMVVITVAFIAEALAVAYAQQTGDIRVLRLLNELPLRAGDLKNGHVWQLLTFQFLHASVWHLLGNLLGIWFIGRFIEARFGPANMLKLYFVGGLVGGLLQAGLGLIFPYQFGAPVVGASAGVVALFAAFAMVEPDAAILLWFVLPVRARHLLWISLGIAIFFILVPAGSRVAHGAHLGGLLTGMAWLKLGWHERWVWPRGENWFGRWRRWRPLQSRERKRELVRAAARGRPWRVAPADTEADLPPEKFISREVDPILDKISAHGLQSLTEHERKILETARKKMAKR
jgi:membrane associated rhomboid family serine protease